METKIRKILRYSAIEELTGLSRVTLWRMIKTGSFPKPIQLGSNSKGFFEDEIMEWQERKAMGRL